MAQDWNWDAASSKQVTAVQQVDAIAVYTNDDGNVVIRQRNPMGDEDDWIVVPPSAVNMLIKALKEEISRK